ncbi:MAG: tRNA pseudouridine(38-40) synthase TruA, partial [Betaproteobacteria bacterium]|nr:tRNA pseudouridine(38-40) synthase TruA [Betaproteobacteria bacterium]
MRIALGLSYAGQTYEGWQSQPNGCTVQDHLETALSSFATQPIRTLCAGRTDSGVHGLMQVVHFDTAIHRDMQSWVRGTNTTLPSDIAVQWAQEVPTSFHARGSALSRRYAYIVLQSPVRPSLEAGRVGWVYRPMQIEPMQEAAQCLLGEHDFTSFRASSCQALSPVKNIMHIGIQRIGQSQDSAYWRFDFQASAFLHHMIRNLMGCFVAIGQGLQPPEWMHAVLQARSRKVAAPTFSADGLYFLGPVYDSAWGLPTRTAVYDSLPGLTP